MPQTDSDKKVGQAPKTVEWGWNGDTCAVWGVALVIGGDGNSREETRAAREAHARRIVTCWNSHDDLLAACKALVEGATEFNDGDFDAIRAAIAKAEGTA